MNWDTAHLNIRRYTWFFFFFFTRKKKGNQRRLTTRWLRSASRGDSPSKLQKKTSTAKHWRLPTLAEFTTQKKKSRTKEKEGLDTPCHACQPLPKIHIKNLHWSTRGTLSPIKWRRVPENVFCQTQTQAHKKMDVTLRAHKPKIQNRRRREDKITTS